MLDSTGFPASILQVCLQWLSFPPNFQTNKILSINIKQRSKGHVYTINKL